MNSSTSYPAVLAMSVLKGPTAHAISIPGVVRGEDHDNQEFQNSIQVQLESSSTSSVILVISSEPVAESESYDLL